MVKYFHDFCEFHYNHKNFCHEIFLTVDCFEANSVLQRQGILITICKHYLMQSIYTAGLLIHILAMINHATWHHCHVLCILN